MSIYTFTRQPLSRQDIEKLTRLLMLAFNYYLDNQSIFFSNYLRALRIVVGLGFTATLVDRDLLCIYQHYLERFMASKEGDFKSNPAASITIAQSTAEMIHTATISFNALRYPRYFDDFVAALHYILTRPLHRTHEDDVEYILTKLGIRSRN